MNEHPVILVRQADALAFCKWLTKEDGDAGRISRNEDYVLPTVEQWRAVARNAPLLNSAIIERAWQTGQWQPTEPVTFGESTPLGLFNLFGNVFEWCQDEEKRKFRVTSPDGGSELKLLTCAAAIGGGWATDAAWLRQQMTRGTFGTIWCPGGWAMQDGGFRLWLVRE